MPRAPLVALLLAATPGVALAAPADDGWEAKGWSCRAPAGCEEAACCRRAVEMFSRPRAGTKLREVRAVGEIDAPPAMVRAVISDFAHLPEFVPHIDESRVVAHDGEDTIVWEIADFSLAKKRDWVVRFHADAAPDGTLRLVWRTETGPLAPPPQADALRMPLNEGWWTFAALDGGRRTRLTYTATTDIGGWIPRWIANHGQVEAMPDVFDGIARRVAVAASLVKR